MSQAIGQKGSPGARSRDIGVKRSVTVTVGAIASKILAVEMVIRGQLDLDQCRTRDPQLPQATRTRPSRAGHTRPFCADASPSTAFELQLDLDAELWQALSQEAINQDVSAQQLLEHAVLYFAAEENAGRVTERIIEDLDEELS